MAHLIGQMVSESDLEVSDSIIGIFQILKVDQIWNGVHPVSWDQLGSYLIEKQRIWLRKPTLIELMERNAKDIIPSYCQVTVSRRSPVHRCGSFGSCKPEIQFFNEI